MASERKRILVVDDDAQLQRLMQLTLKRQGYDVIVASNGEEAIAKVISEKPDLILMDVMMPDMDGYEATKRIRRLPEGRDIPVLFLSALTHVDAKVKGLRVGGSDYITKPVHFPELLARIEAHLRATLPPLGSLLTLMGCKGGIGTTTLAVNLALAIRQQQDDAQVLIVDWQRPLGDVATFLGLADPKSIDLILPQAEHLDEEVVTQMMTSYAEGINVLAGSVDPENASRMSLDALSALLEVALTLADYIIVDAGEFWEWQERPLISKDVGMNLCVVTPEITAIKRALLALQSIVGEEYDIHFVLSHENMPGGVSGKQLESHLGAHILGKLPYEPETTTRSMNVGRPVMRLDPRSRYARAVQALAKNILAGV